MKNTTKVLLSGLSIVLLTSCGGDKPESPSATEKEQVVSTESEAVELKTDGSVNLLDVLEIMKGVVMNVQ